MNKRTDDHVFSVKAPRAMAELACRYLVGGGVISGVFPGIARSAIADAVKAGELRCPESSFWSRSPSSVCLPWIGKIKESRPVYWDNRKRDEDPWSLISAKIPSDPLDRYLKKKAPAIIGARYVGNVNHVVFGAIDRAIVLELEQNIEKRISNAKEQELSLPQMIAVQQAELKNCSAPSRQKALVRSINRKEEKLQTAIRRGKEAIAVSKLLSSFKEEYDSAEYYSATILLLILMEAIYYGDKNVNAGIYNPELPAMLLDGWAAHQQRRKDLHLPTIA